MTESKTPRTDEAQFGTGRVSVSFARELELELAVTKKALELACEHTVCYRQCDIYGPNRVDCKPCDIAYFTAKAKEELL